MKRSALVPLLALATSVWAAGPERDFKHLVDEASRAWSDGRTVDAIAALEAARAIKPAGRVVFNLARAYEKAGDLEAALRTYEEYLSLPDSEPTALHRARASLAALYREVTRPRSGSSLALDAGVAAPSESSIAPDAGVASDAPRSPVNLEPPEPRQPVVVTGPVPLRGARMTTTPGLVLTVVGLVGLAAGGGLGGWASVTAAEARNSVDPVQKPALRDAAIGRATAADATFLGAGVVTALGVVLWLLGVTP